MIAQRAPEARMADHEVHPSRALVPLTGDRKPRTFVPPGASPHPGAGTVIYVLWYGSVAALLIGGAASGLLHGDWIVLSLLAGVFAAMTGLCITVYTLNRPTERKVRQALGAGAALVASIAAVQPLSRAGTEIRLSRQVTAMQPAVDELLRFRLLTRWDNYQGLQAAEINGTNAFRPEAAFVPPSHADLPTMNEALAKAGATGDQLQHVVSGLRSAGIGRIEMTAGGVALTMTEHSNRLLYLPPGRERRPTEAVFNRVPRQSTPLGGGWYLLEDFERDEY